MTTRHLLQKLAFPGILLTGSFSSGEILSFKFQDSQDQAFASNVTAGAPGYEVTNWNFLQTDWSGNAQNDAVLLDLRNSAGQATTSLQGISYGIHTDVVHYDAANTWRSGVGNATPDDTLMNGYLDDGGNEQPYVNFSLAPDAFPIYSVVLYVHGDGVNGPVGRYWLEEWTDPLAEGTVITDQVAISQNEYAGTFVQAGSDFPQTLNPLQVDVPQGNFIVFTNLTARNVRIRAAGNGDPEDAGRGPLNAVQILDLVINPGGDDDNDGLLNGWEEAFGLNPNSDQGNDGGLGNPDGDGLNNLAEQARGTNPILADTDADGLNDEVETGSGVFVSLSDTGTDPLDSDSDDDGLLDGAEDNSGTYVSGDQAGSDPHQPDSDGDNLPDGWEAINGLDPSDDGSLDAANGPDGDPDSDSSSNSQEFALGTLPNNGDTDDDGYLDGYESHDGVFVSASQTGTDPLDPDSDDDTLLDGVETGDGNFIDANATGTNPNVHDTDEDGYFDEQEVAAGTDPNLATSKPSFPLPVGFWSFDDQDAAMTADDSGGGNPGTLVGGPTYIAGHSGRAGDFALGFDGLDDDVRTSLSVSGFANFTLAGWVRAPGPQTGTAGLFGQNDVVEFGYNQPGNLHLWSNPGGAINFGIQPAAEWRHVAITGDNTGRRLFVDGLQVASGVAGSPLGTSAFTVTMGGGTIFNENGNFFVGDLNDVGVWDVSMSDALIAGLADGSLNPLPGLGGGELAVTAIEVRAGRIDLTISGTVSGRNYAIEESLTLLDGSWGEVVQFVGAADGDVTEVTVTVTPGSRAFYRVRLSGGN